MKDNGKTEAVKNCATCQYLGKSERCQNCRNGNPPADAAAYDLLWENDAREFTPGEVVMWAGSEYTVLSVCESDGAKMLELLKNDVDEGNSGEFMISRNLVPAARCAKQVKELTAKEYAEKLREVLGVKLEAVDNFADLDICDGLNCRECPFDHKRLEAAGYHGDCVALIVYHPDLAVKLMDEWQANKDKPKGKTYLEDFREKFPKAEYLATGSPVQCRNKLYFAGAPCSVKPCPNCCDCWNEVMPAEGGN